MIRRISLFAGPGAGKSTLTAWLFAELKFRGIQIEHVTEFCKAWAFIGRPPVSWDQLYIVSKQIHREDIVLRADPNYKIITDSPLLLASCYGKKYNSFGYKQIKEIVSEFEAIYPSLNIFIDRTDLKYSTVGRFQNYEQALELDEFITEAMDESGIKYHIVSHADKHRMLDLCLENLENHKI